MVLSSILLALALFLLAMTQPHFGTPVANWALAKWGPDGARVERANVKFPAITTVVASGLDLPDRLNAQSLEARVNIFGFLPFVSWISRLESADGYIRLDGQSSGEGDATISDYRAVVDDIVLSGIEIRLGRERGPDTILLEEARGSLRSGALMIRAKGAGSQLRFNGTSTNSLSAIEGKLIIAGDNFADVASLAGLAAPDTPPYNVRMSVAIRDQTWRLDFEPDTRVGDSDMSGKVRVDLNGDTPTVDADLYSSSLDADDLGIVFGIPIGVGEDETVGTEQTRAREAYNRSSRLIPAVEIDFSRLDAVDGTINFEAREVVDSVFDIKSLQLNFEIEGRVVRAPLVMVGFGDGSIDAYATIDGTRSPAVTTVEGNLNEVPMDSLALSPYARGHAEGRFKFEATGDGFRQAAGQLNGSAAVWSTDADILALAVEGAALDLVEALTVLGEPADDRSYVEARCLAVVVEFADGIGSFAPAVIDTDDSLVVVRGEVDLGTERLKLSVRSDAKDASLGTLIGDVGIGGTLRNPEIQPFSAQTVAQFGLVGILASLSGGLAALPFIEPGAASDAPCGALLNRAQKASEESAVSN